MLNFFIAAIDIEKAYFQGGELSRDIYVYPPRGWASSPYVVWKLISPAYGITESGKLWMKTAENWMFNFGL